MSDYVLDITLEHCPMTFVKTKLQLSRMKSGETLDILLTDGEVLENLPESAAEQGYQVLSVSHVKGNIHKVVIRK